LPITEPNALLLSVAFIAWPPASDMEVLGFWRLKSGGIRRKTDKNREMKTSLASYLDWQSKLSDQKPSANFLVLYTSSATDACAVVIDRRMFDHPFVVDHKTYWCECNSEAEAHFLAAYVNSNFANDKIKEFQSRGLFGPRDIHKLVVKLSFPKFQKGEARHEELSILGSKCASLALNFVRNAKVDDLEARALGAVRARLKEQLNTELEQIDDLVAALSSGGGTFERKPRKRARGARLTSMLFD
jgi:hypothetical protein